MSETPCAMAGPVAPLLAIPLVLDSPVATRSGQPVTVGLPLPRGALHWPSPLALAAADGRPVPVQAEPLARWSDGTARWLLLDFLAGPLGPGLSHWRLTAGRQGGSPAGAPGCVTYQGAGTFEIDTGAVSFRLNGPGAVLPQVFLAGRPMFAGCGARVVLTDADGRSHGPRVERITCEATGPVRATVCLAGAFAGVPKCRFVTRLDAFADTGLLRVRLTLHNPRRAKHPGGLWDLGDPGSLLFRDLSLEWDLADGGPGSRASWLAEADGPVGAAEAGPVEIYQDSSGGANWDSRNHVNRHGRVPCSFRGYRARAGGREFRGLRANPVLTACGPGAAVSVAVPDFWQRFPKALEWDAGTLRVRLFPAQFGDLHELQGGEQITHTVWLDCGRPGTGPAAVSWAYHPVVARSTPAWYAESGAFPHLAPADVDAPSRLDGYLAGAIEGDMSLFAGREVIDEYGWRNYGEIYANHEVAYYKGPKPVVSHYNNQYDSVFGAILQFFRTGDQRWWNVAAPLASHVADIDVYHTTEDKAGYNGGLFWLTDHYKDVATATHRTYSRANVPRDGRPYGGGPGCEHNFTTGLATYYFLTGDPVARAAALSLADWVVAMDDGARTVLAFLDGGPTGAASFTLDPNYHGPGRGPGLSINALLDGWLLTGRRAYLEKAEELIRRCVHPADEVASRDLLNVELHWSYTVFLVALDRYLSTKAEAGELDGRYAYARASLLHYAAWMLEHEVPYFDHPERLEYPTETWAAQEFRKANVLRLAAAHAHEPLGARLLKRGEELADRAWHDLLRFESRHVARAVAILMTEGTRDEWFRRSPPGAAPRPASARDFGRPETFVPQKRRVRALLRSPLRLAQAMLRLAHTVARPRVRAGVRVRKRIT
jgi:hypothetical protein